MKNRIITIVCIFCTYFLYAQDKSLDIDLLKSPTSPASNLLGIATSEINKPTDVSNLMLNLQDFTSMFKNNAGYAIDFAPYWLFGKQTKSLDNIIRDSLVSDVIKQTFVFSIAVKNTDSTNTKLPLNSVFTSYGFKFSLLRGKALHEVSNNYAEIKEIHQKILNSTKDATLVLRSDPEIQKKEKELEGLVKSKSPDIKKCEDELKALKLKKLDELNLDKSNFLTNSKIIKEKLENFSIVRKGFLWDFAGGTSIQFREKQFNNSRIYNAGLWTVFGYAFEKSGTPLLLVRYMYNPKSDWMTTEDFKTDGNFSTFDAGLKYEYSPKDSKFTGSFEGLYRSFISGSDLKPTWKCVLNLDYAIFPNQHLTLSLGKDFDNNIIKNGNVIAGLSFLSGIGTKRKIQ